MPTPDIRTGLQAWTIIEIGLGRVLRFTSSPVELEIVDNDGNVYSFAPGLSDIPARFGPNAGASVNVNISSTPAGAETWAELISKGHLLERAEVTVSRWIAGNTLEGVDAIIVGKVSRPHWGGQDEPVDFSVNRRRREAGLLPPPSHTFDSSTWPVEPGFVLDPAAVGASYPQIWGRVTTGTLPAYLVEFDGADLPNCRLHFAGHYIEAAEVEVFDEGISIGVATVEPKQDLQGVWCSTVTFGSLDVAPQFDRAYRVALNQGGGGWAVGAGEEAPWGAGDMMAALLQQGTFEIDWPRFRGAQQLLNAYLIGFGVLGSTEIWTIVQAILGILPVDWVQGPKGAYPKVRVVYGTSVDVVGAIDCTRVTGQIDRTSRMETAGPNTFNEFSIRYGLAGAQQRPQSVRFTGAGMDYGGALNLSDQRAIPSYWCGVSRGLYGELPKPPIVTELVHDDATAGLILRDLAMHFALPRGAWTVRGDTTLDRFDSDDIIAADALDIAVDGEAVVIRDKVAHDNDTLELQVMILDPLALRRRAL